MRTDYRGAVVEKVESRVTKRTGVVRLDKRSMTFFAREVDTDFPTQPFASKDGATVRNWLQTQLDRTSAADRLDWVPVVEVKAGGEGGHHYYRDDKQEHEQSLSITINRYYLALTHDEREWRKLQWEACDPKSVGNVPENDRYAQSHKYGEGPKTQNPGEKPFILPSYKPHRYSGGTVLHYTPELWKGLLLIVKQIEAQRKLLAELIGTKDGIAGVAEIGAGRQTLRLSPPKEDA